MSGTVGVPVIQIFRTRLVDFSYKVIQRKTLQVCKWLWLNICRFRMSNMVSRLNIDDFTSQGQGRKNNGSAQSFFWKPHMDVGYAMQLAAVEAQSPNHWPAREFPPSLLMYLLSTHKHTPDSADLKNKGKGKPRTSLNNTSLFQQLFHCSAFFYSQPDWKTWLYLSPGTFGLFDHDP